MRNTSPKPKPKNNQLNFTEDHIRSRAYEIWCDRNGTGNSRNGKYNPVDDWNAAIESLRLERSRLRRINVYLWKTFTSPYRLTKESTEKVLSSFTNREDRSFNLDVVKTVISVSSVMATVVAGIGLFITYNENNERLITDRFSKAVEQLGSDKLEIRLGGIYALERISNDSPRDYWTVMEVLTAFVREYAKKTPNTTEKQITHLPKKTTQKQIVSTQTSTDEEQISPLTTDIEIEAVLSVIRRRKLSYEKGEHSPLDLRGINVQREFMESLDLQGARLFGANLQGADLSSANLQGARLFSANLQGARLFNANLQGAFLASANLQGAFLASANLQGAHLSSANLQGAHLKDVKMQEAQYTDKNTSGETCNHLTVPQNYPCPTLFPPNFDPKAAGMVLIK